MSLLTIAICALFSLADASAAGSKNRAANRLYDKGEYEEALRLYDEALAIDSADGKLKMNRGSALYRLNEFDEAERSYLDALSKLPPSDKKALADAHYNLGNAQFRQGEQLESAGDLASARGKYSRALENYVGTLKLRPNDKDAKWNLQLAHQKIDMLRDQQDQPQDQDGGDDKQRDDQGGEDDKRDQDKSDDRKDQSGEEGDNDEQDQNRQERQQQSDGEERDIKREEAERMIEQFADDDEELNKPVFQRGRIRQPEKDW